MYQRCNEYDFVEAFKRMDRENQFTVQGRRALYEYLESLEEDTGEPYILDVIALCCAYVEFKNRADYEKQDEPFDGDDDAFLEHLEYQTQVIMLGESLNDGFIIQQF